MVKFNTILSVKRAFSTPTEPVTLSEVKTHLNITFTDYDSYLTAMITQVRELAEQMTGLAIVTQTVTAAVRNELGGVHLPYGPVVSVTSCVDINGDAVDYETFGVDHLQVSTLSDYLKFVYVSGFTTVPSGLKRAILEEVAYQWNHRGDEILDGLSPQAKRKFKTYKVNTWLL